ncbi:hypothetical protein BROUX41_000422 [Berkeleyomyces rouxiae]|uniref:uncharacterized protein n=1 Tax=Berkeleyomyces rouxiae TaxID=2035830 RepID=UPI003B7D9FD3
MADLVGTEGIVSPSSAGPDRTWSSSRPVSLREMPEPSDKGIPEPTTSLHNTDAPTNATTHASPNPDHPADLYEPDHHEQQAIRSFDPPLTLVTNTTSGTTYHPQVYYIFSDDEPDTLTHALQLANTRNPGLYDRAVIVDLQPTDSATGWTVASASSITADWAVTNAQFTPLGGSSGPATSTSGGGGGTVPTGGSDSDGDMILEITGTDAIALPRTIDIPIERYADPQSSNPHLEPDAKNYAPLMAEFAESMKKLSLVVEAGQVNMQQSIQMLQQQQQQRQQQHRDLVRSSTAETTTANSDPKGKGKTPVYTSSSKFPAE